MLGNIHNVMTDLMDHIGAKESDLPWTWSVDQNVGDLEIRLNTQILPEVVRRPIMVCSLQVSRQEQGQHQIIFLVKNTLFQPIVMTRVLEYLSSHPIDVV
jgi:hypothetical protein